MPVRGIADRKYQNGNGLGLNRRGGRSPSSMHITVPVTHGIDGNVWPWRSRADARAGPRRARVCLSRGHGHSWP